jgi:hypothetical protein
MYQVDYSQQVIQECQTFFETPSYLDKTLYIPTFEIYLSKIYFIESTTETTQIMDVLSGCQENKFNPNFYEENETKINMAFIPKKSTKIENKTPDTCLKNNGDDILKLKFIDMLDYELWKNIPVYHLSYFNTIMFKIIYAVINNFQVIFLDINHDEIDSEEKSICYNFIEKNKKGIAFFINENNNEMLRKYSDNIIITHQNEQQFISAELI